IGPQAHAGIVGVVAAPGIDTDTIRKRLVPVHEIAHLTVELRKAA
ncbi:MAG: cation transporter, partial [Proteobacteria bacterium]|nr:cation transporter [Pseudomonadota bacterium]